MHKCSVYHHNATPPHTMSCSAQIGQMEDAEDMKREQMELSRKRRKMELKKSGGKASLLQSKLNFHTGR